MRSSEEKALVLVMDGETLSAEDHLETFFSNELIELERAARELADLCAEERLSRVRRGMTA